MELTSSAQFSLLVAQAGGQDLPLTIERDGQLMQVTVTPKLDAATGAARLGVWVPGLHGGGGHALLLRPDTGTYAALGHAITDGDTGEVLTVDRGQILKADIVSVQKGEKGAPGSSRAAFCGKRGAGRHRPKQHPGHLRQHE